MVLNTGELLQEFALLTLNNLLVISVGMLFFGVTFFAVSRFLRKRGQVGPIIGSIHKYGRRFNEVSLFLVFLLFYFTGQFLYVIMRGNLFFDIMPPTLLVSLIIGGIIGLKVEMRTFKGNEPSIEEDHRTVIPVRKEGELPYYEPNEPRPIPWDNLSHGFWKKYDRGVFWSALILLVLLLIMVVGLLFFMVFIILYSLFDEPWVPGAVGLVMSSVLIFYLLINLRKLVFLSKVRGWEYTSLSHPDLTFDRMRKGVSSILDSNGFTYDLEVYRMMGNRYIYHRIKESDMCVRLMFSNSPIKGEYTISIGPLDSINMYDREMVKYQLSRWARGNIRPRIGYYRILDASYLWRKNRTDINDHLERCRAIAGLKGKK